VSVAEKPARARLFVLWVCVFLAGLVCLARAERLPVRSYTSADGLGSNFINSLMRDSRGFLWFCTRDGLSRFDGSRFVTYQVGDKNSPPGIEQIIETRKGIYLISTTGGLYRFDPAAAPSGKTENTDRPSLNAELMDNDRSNFYEDRNGNLWAGGDGLYLMEDKGGKISRHKIELNLPVNPSLKVAVFTICEGQDGSLWLATTVGIVRRLPDGREIFYSAAFGQRMATGISMLEDRTGHIWVGRSSGIFIIKPEPLDALSQLGPLTLRAMDDLAQPQTQNRVSLPEEPGEIFKYTDVEGFAESPAKFLYQTADGHVWIAGGDGVIEFDGQKFIAHTTAQGLLKGVGPMVEDTGGNLWLGWTTGLMRLDRYGVSGYNAADGLKNFPILAIGESPEGKLYVVDDHYSLSQFDGKGFQTIRPQLPVDAKAVWTSNAVFQDHLGEWWVLTNGKIYHFAASDNFNALARMRPLAAYAMGDGLKGGMMFHIFEDAEGNVWVSTRGSASSQNGLSRWDRGEKKFSILSEADGYKSDKAVSSFAEDRSGNLWLGFYQGGLARYSHGRFKEFAPSDGLPSGVITALHLDKQGRLWLASSDNGLNRIDETTDDHPHFVNYSYGNGLSSNNVRSITEDLYGNIYAGTARGVDKLSPDARRIQHYSVKDGLAGDFVTVAFRDRSGALWFGTPNGLSRLVPEPEVESAAPSVWLGSLRIAGERRALPELGIAEIADLELAHTQNNLQIDFFGVDFKAGETLRYQYMLEGADQDWSAPTEQQTVNYANLAPGSYRFLVRAVSDSGVASAHPASISFYILPPFWRRWWFLTLAALAVGLTVFALDRYRANRMKELDAALTESTLLTETLTTQRSELRKANRVLELEYEVTSILTEATTPLEAAPKILEVICRDINWDVGVIWNVDEENARLRCQDVWPPQAVNDQEFRFKTLEHTFARGEGLAGRVWATGEAQWATELEGDANIASVADRSQKDLKSAFGFPVTLEGEVIGVLEFFNQERRERDPELLEMMSSVGGHIGQLIERRRTEEALQRSREERLRELERVRTRIATDLHDDIGSSLTQIVILSEVAQQQINGHDSAMAEPLTKITSVSNELVEAMSDIVWAINPKKDHLSDLVQRMRRFASDIFSACQIHFTFSAPHADGNIQLGANMRRELFLIFKESVNNIARHSGCTEAQIEFYEESGSLHLKLSDNGRGFDVVAAGAGVLYSKGGNGLMSMKRRAEELYGSFEITSRPGQGTKTSLRVPLGQTASFESPHPNGR
jgi:signal transduction histidine kinase/ligand-binding sensor domain-containing protein